ncbi:MAG: SDR family oxidoreductase [Gaiellaceae bacterium]
MITPVTGTGFEAGGGGSTLSGRTALVTGVSRRAGIGFAIARQLCDRGASVFVRGWSPHDAAQDWGADPGGMEAVARELGTGFVEADFSDPSAPSHVIAARSRTLADRGITVNAVNPGPTDTGWAAGLDPPPAMPCGRWGTPDDAARLVAWLCSEDGRWVTGQVIDSEGGFRRWR